MTLHFDYHPYWCSGNNQSVGSSVPVVSRWLWPGNRTFLEAASMVITWWIAGYFLHSETTHKPWHRHDPQLNTKVHIQKFIEIFHRVIMQITQTTLHTPKTLRFTSISHPNFCFDLLQFHSQTFITIKFVDLYITITKCYLKFDQRFCILELLESPYFKWTRHIRNRTFWAHVRYRMYATARIKNYQHINQCKQLS